MEEFVNGAAAGGGGLLVIVVAAGGVEVIAVESDEGIEVEPLHGSSARLLRRRRRYRCPILSVLAFLWFLFLFSLKPRKKSG